MRFAPEAVVRWRLRPTLSATWLQYFRYARGDARAGMLPRAPRAAVRRLRGARRGARLAAHLAEGARGGRGGRVRADAGASRLAPLDRRPRARVGDGRRARPDGVDRLGEDGRLCGGTRRAPPSLTVGHPRIRPPAGAFPRLRTHEAHAGRLAARLAPDRLAAGALDRTGDRRRSVCVPDQGDVVQHPVRGVLLDDQGRREGDPRGRRRCRGAAGGLREDPEGRAAPRLVRLAADAPREPVPDRAPERKPRTRHARGPDPRRSLGVRGARRWRRLGDRPDPHTVVAERDVRDAPRRFRGRGARGRTGQARLAPTAPGRRGRADRRRAADDLRGRPEHALAPGLDPRGRGRARVAATLPRPAGRALPRRLAGDRRD